VVVADRFSTAPSDSERTKWAQHSSVRILDPPLHEEHPTPHYITLFGNSRDDSTIYLYTIDYNKVVLYFITGPDSRGIKIRFVSSELALS
jgi:hypothetical protein